MQDYSNFISNALELPQFSKNTWFQIGIWPGDRVVSHFIDVIMTTIASQITSLAVVYSAVYSDADQRKHQSSASLAFVRWNHRDRWIPRTQGQLRGKCFNLMTSSWTRLFIFELLWDLVRSRRLILLTHWDRDKMDAIWQTTFWRAFSWMKMFEFRLNFHWTLFLRVQLTIFRHWFR